MKGERVPQLGEKRNPASIVNLVSMGFFMAAGVVGLCWALARYQPWAGIGLCSVFSFLALWGLDWFIPKFRKRKSSQSGKRKDEDVASLGFMVTAAASFSTTYLQRTGMAWLALSLFAVSMGLLFLTLRKGWGGIRGLIREVTQWSESPDEGEFDEEPDALGVLPRIAGFLAAAVILFLVFFPLVVLSAKARGLPIIDALLFVDTAGGSANLGVLDRIRLVVSQPAFLWSLGVLYAAMTITRIAVSALRLRSLLETASTTFGLMVGYTIAVYVARWSGAEIQFMVLTPGLGLAYVFLLHYVTETIMECLPKWGMRSKYSQLLGGLESIGTAFLLSRSYGTSAAMLGGAAFFASSFVGAALWEATLGRLLLNIAPSTAYRPLMEAWNELRTLARSEHLVERRRAAVKEALVVSLLAICIPSLAVYLVKLGVGP